MIVVSDTSPLTALLTIGQEGLLPILFTEVIIPNAVQKELLRTHYVLPDWLRVVNVENFLLAEKYALLVDTGEAEAIALALELKAERLLIDERKGRKLASEEGVAIIGLLGVLILAKRKNIIPSARNVLLQLEKEAGIYLKSEIRDAALKNVGE